MARPWRGRQSRRDRILGINATHMYNAMLSRNPNAVAIAEQLCQPVPPEPRKREIRRPVDGKPAVPLEKTVLASALEALRYDPRVAIVDRRQSGLFQDGDRYIRVGTPGVLDISGMLKGGRYFEIEAKRPGERPTEKQEKRIALVKSGGGISGYFTSVESALALLP